jgi:hypothetical protein
MSTGLCFTHKHKAGIPIAPFTGCKSDPGTGAGPPQISRFVTPTHACDYFLGSKNTTAVTSAAAGNFQAIKCRHVGKFTMAGSASLVEVTGDKSAVAKGPDAPTIPPAASERGQPASEGEKYPILPLTGEFEKKTVVFKGIRNISETL